MISKMTEPCILCGDNQIPTKKSLQHRNDFNYQRTLHPLWGHSNPNWITQIIIEMITKMTDPYILCWDIQVSNERSLHLLLGHLKSNWKKQFSIKMISKMTEPYILCEGDSDPNWERQFSIEMITNMKEPYILWGDIQIPIDRTSHLFLGHSNSTGENRSVPKWFQKWQKLTSFWGTLKFQLKKTVQYWNDFKDHRTLHPLWDIPIPTENLSLLLKWLKGWQKLT